MAACSFGGSIVKVQNLNLSSAQNRFSLQQLHGTKFPLQIQFDALKLSRRSEKNPFIERRCMTSQCESTTAASVSDDFKEEKSPGTITKFAPNPVEVEYLLTQICDTTTVAEFELKLDGFRLYVKRDLGEKTAPLQAPVVAPPVSNAIIKAGELNGSASSTSLATIEPSGYFVSPSSRVQTLLDTAADEGLLILRSPTVGKFRRSRARKGKIAPPACKERQIVKEGKVLCFIEQLDSQIPVESDISGEIIKVLVEDGEPVGYGDALIAIRPTFPG